MTGNAKDARFWNKAAEKYAKSAISDPESYQITLDKTRSYLRPTDRVLELGCGTGSTGLLLAPGVKQYEATDLSSKMLEIARSKAASDGIDNITFKEASASDTSLGEGVYDTVLGFNLFHLVSDPSAVYRQIHAALAPGGTFISKTPCLGEPGWGWKGALVRVAIPVMQFFGKAPQHVGLVPVAKVEQEIAAAGFEIVEACSHPAGPPPSRYIVARRV